MEVFRAIHIGCHSALLDPIFWVISTSGLGWVQALLTLVLLRWEHLKAYVWPLLAVTGVSGFAIADVVKKLTPRDRPSNLIFAHPQETFWGNSFPSGHTASSFGIAMLLFLMTRGTDHAKVGRWSLVWASCVGLSRVYRGVHWPTDVLAGACCGIAAACIVYLGFRKYGHTLCAAP